MQKLMPISTKTVKVIDHVATGKRMQNLRYKSGLSGKKVADLLGFSQPMLAMLEKGRKNWSEDLCERFQEALKK